MILLFSSDASILLACARLYGLYSSPSNFLAFHSVELGIQVRNPKVAAEFPKKLPLPHLSSAPQISQNPLHTTFVVGAGGPNTDYVHTTFVVCKPTTIFVVDTKFPKPALSSVPPLFPKSHIYHVCRRCPLFPKNPYIPHLSSVPEGPTQTFPLPHLSSVESLPHMSSTPNFPKYVTRGGSECRHAVSLNWTASKQAIIHSFATRYELMSICGLCDNCHFRIGFSLAPLNASAPILWTQNHMKTGHQDMFRLQLPHVSFIFIIFDAHGC
jgi:hypothetical protein